MSRKSSLILIETDILVAAINPYDRHHNEAKTIIKILDNSVLSPYAVIELDLLIRSATLVINDYQLFWVELSNLLDYYNIDIPLINPLHFIEANKLRKQYNLTYFDSLHAATALVEDFILLSYDEGAYSRVEGLNYVHPTKFLSKK
ncbi:MAG: type II toxin-antitoxin system VapC family toxin [Desulfurococcales archaeon]|nr:type II toxin-antitoxin system VapC family toxin [Desulfurococcales archaeon]